MGASESVFRLFRAATERGGANRELEQVIERFRELCALPDEDRARRHLEIADQDPRLAIRLADLFEAAAGASGAWSEEVSRARRLDRGLARARERARAAKRPPG